MTFGEYMQRQRLAREMTVSELSTSSGVSRQAIMRLEKGSDGTRASTLARILNAMRAPDAVRLRAFDLAAR